MEILQCAREENYNKVPLVQQRNMDLLGEIIKYQGSVDYKTSKFGWHVMGII